MKTGLKKIPAEGLLAQFDAEERAERLKQDKTARQKASRYAAAETAFYEACGFSPDAQRILHIMLDKTRGSAPHELVKISETEAGALLPGQEGIKDESYRKRWTRALAEVLDPECARLGKCLYTRIMGKFSPPTPTAPEIKKCAEYRCEIAQAVVDVERRANEMKGLKRSKALRLAALEVKESLPDYVAPKSKPKTVKQGPRVESLAGGRTRRMTRWQIATKEMIREAKDEGPEALNRLRERLHAELETLFADAETEGPEKAKSSALLFEADSQISEQKRDFDPLTVDSTVHESGDFLPFDKWLKANRERVNLWCKDSETEQWQMYEAERALWL
jgi:hypothetical protein